MTKMKEIEKKSDAELNTFVSEKREAVRQARFGTGSRDVKATRTNKKEIARALTLLGKRAKTATKEVTK